MPSRRTIVLRESIGQPTSWSSASAVAKAAQEDAFDRSAAIVAASRCALSALAIAVSVCVIAAHSGCQRNQDVGTAAAAPQSAAPRATASEPAAPTAVAAANATATVSGPSIVPRAPRAEQVPRVFEVHGQRVVDDYRWMQKRDDPRVLDYLDAENRYADAVLQHTEELQKKLNTEILRRVKQTDSTVPQRYGDYFYYSRREKSLQYDIHCRRQGSLEAPEQIILDENELAEDQDYFALGACELSPDHRYLAYSTDSDGSERYTLRIKDLEENRLLAESIPGTAESVAWASDNRTLFYTTRDAASRPYRLYRHVLGSDRKHDMLVHEETDPAFYLSISRTRNDRFLLMDLASNSTTETRFLDAANPTGEFQVIAPRRAGIEYSVAHQGDTFWIVTNDSARNFRLVSVPVAAPEQKNWREIIPNRDNVKLDGVEVFAEHLVLLERRGGLPAVRVRDIPTGETHAIEFTEPCYSVSLDDNPEFNTSLLRFTFSSLITPDSVYEYDMVKHTRKLLKRQEIAGGYEAARYQQERIFAHAPDGQQVPISLVYRRDLKRDGRAPTLLYAYGAYGYSEDPAFDVARLSLLDRGFIYAIAHVRGGGEMGRAWYESGKLKDKPNTFTDFIACAEKLIKEKYTSPDRLAITGASAGGLLVGSVLNMRPELFHVAVAEVPFVDVLNTMLDPTMPLTVTEYEEWGDPRAPADFDLIRSYSPYDNVRAQSYPHMLVRTGLNDSRVHYWEAAKWVARLRATKTDHRLLLLKVDLAAGHNGASGRYDYLDSEATEYAFILDCLGITE